MMNLSRIHRLVVALGSLLFAAVALGFWVAPEQTARRFGLAAAGAHGIVTLRADLAGLFAGMAVLAALAAWTARRSSCYAAATMLTAIAFGRAIGWIGNAAIAGDFTDMAIEIAVVVALLGIARDSASGAATVPVRRRRPVLVAGALLAIPAAGGAALLAPTVQQRIFDRIAQQRAGTTNSAPLADDALRVAICGSSAPLPSASRAKACVAVFAGGKFYLVDVGPESVENLMLWGIPMSSIGGVMLTHFHSDHIGDLGELNLQTWAGGRPAQLSVYGGPGVERVVDGFNAAYRLDQGYRTRHHGEQVMPPPTWPMVSHVVELDGLETPARNRSALVLEDGGLKITAWEVDHTPIAPAYAYRFDYKGRSVFVTGDTKFHQPLAKAAAGVDLLVSEAIAVSMTRALGAGATSGGRDRAAAVMHDIEDYHITPQQAAEIASEARAKLLVFYHLLPAPDGMLARRLFAQGLDSRVDWTLADDGSLYTMPLGSQSVLIGQMAE